MKISVTLPSPGESISEVQLAQWLVEDGQYVEKDSEIAEIDSEKATLSITAPESGKIELKGKAGDVLPVGSEIALIDSDAKSSEMPKQAPPITKTGNVSETIPEKEEPENKNQDIESGFTDNLHLSPLARKILQLEGVTEAAFIEKLKTLRFTRDDVRELISTPAYESPETKKVGNSDRNEDRQTMSMLRRKLAERLVSVKNSTAMLTTFNEVDMSVVKAIREQHKESFLSHHGVKLSYMSFFTLAASLALREFPQVNSRIEENDIITPDFQDIGIAVSTQKGLMVPVIRNVNMLNLGGIEKEIAAYAQKARSGKLSPEDMNGGTFTITNGGVFGSMLSTPIINPPQSAILGMHNIIERPVVKNGRIVIAPVMYLALSYDHRIIDGKESVGFLTTIKKYIENPLTMLNSGKDLSALLLDI